MTTEPRPSHRGTPAAVLFDLDGTLADTAPDLVFALNTVLEEAGLTAVPFEVLRPHVSGGGRAMIDFAVGVGHPQAERDRLRRRFLDVYLQNIATRTHLFPGMEEVLAAIEGERRRWGVVTNKLAAFTAPLMQALGLDRRAACVVSGDTTAHSKPHPAPLLHACAALHLAAQSCLYVGDHERDIIAGREAGMTTVAAGFGYLAPEEDPRAWGADGCIASPLELLPWLAS